MKHRNDPFLHHEDGTHRGTAPTANGHDLERFDNAIRVHMADHQHIPVAELRPGDVILDMDDEPTVHAIQNIGPVSIIDMTDGTATAPVPVTSVMTIRRRS